MRGTQPVSQWLGGSSGGIKSIQRGTITVGAGNLTATATITTVVPANTRLVWIGNSSTEDGTTSVPSAGLRVDLTNSTTVTATRLATTGSTIVSFEVVEYVTGMVRSVQRGTISVTNGNLSGTATFATTLTNVDRATLDVLGWNHNTALFLTQMLARIAITNTTTLTMTRAGSANELTAGYQVTEWM